MKSIGSYEIAALLICVFWFVGCSGPMCGPSSSSNPPRMSSVPSAQDAQLKFLYAVISIQERVEEFVINARMGRIGAAGRAVGTDDAPIYAAATLDNKFLYVANAGTKTIGVSGNRIDGPRVFEVEASRSEQKLFGRPLFVGGGAVEARDRDVVEAEVDA